jgi:hypothetical protein
MVRLTFTLPPEAIEALGRPVVNALSTVDDPAA